VFYENLGRAGPPEPAGARQPSRLPWGKGTDGCFRWSQPRMWRGLPSGLLNGSRVDGRHRLFR